MIVRAQYGTHDGRIVRAFFDDGTIAPLTADDPSLTGVVIEPYEGPAPAKPPLYKNALYDAMTDDELTLLDATLSQVSPRQRRRFSDAVYLERDDPELRAMATALYGPERASELLDNSGL